jgi:hypothetical protein
MSAIVQPDKSASGVVIGLPRLLLRSEGGAALALGGLVGDSSLAVSVALI